MRHDGWESQARSATNSDELIFASAGVVRETDNVQKRYRWHCTAGYVNGGPHAYLFIQTPDGTTVWSQFTTAGSVNFTGEVPLKRGEYRLVIDAGYFIDSGSGGIVVADAQSSLTVDGATIEGPKKGGKVPR